MCPNIFKKLDYLTSQATRSVTSYTRVPANEPSSAPYSRGMSPRTGAVPPHGSVVYLHGVGGARPEWWRPVSRALGGLTVDLTAPSYDDLLTTAGRIHARRAPRSGAGSPDGDRRAYLERQRQLAGLVDAVGESTRLAWPASLPHPAELADRLPLAAMLRAPVFGLDQVGRYLDDTARRAAVLHRIATAMLRAPRPRVVIAHSLGSVVAWDLLADPRIEVDLLITLGSPLAHPALGVAPDAFPYHRVGAWLNVVHLLDPVPAGRGLRDAFPAACDAFLSPLPGVAPSGSAVARFAAAVAGAATSHLDSTYLASRTVLAAVREAMHVATGLSAPAHSAVAS